VVEDFDRIDTTHFVATLVSGQTWTMFNRATPKITCRTFGTRQEVFSRLQRQSVLLDRPKKRQWGHSGA
jgi:hypothetical protein